MQKKSIKKRIAALALAAVTVLGMIHVLPTSTHAAPTKAQLEGLEADMDRLQQQKQEIESRIGSLEYDQMSAIAKKEVLDEKVMLTEASIANCMEQIETYEELIAEKETEVSDAIIAEENQWEMYKDRIRFMEESGDISYYSILFGASSFSDLLSALDFISEIMDYDELVYNRLVESREATEAAKAQLEDTLRQQELVRESLEQYNQELLIQVAEADYLISSLEDDLAEYEAHFNAMEAEEKALQEEIDEMVEELEKLMTAGSRVVGTGSFIWPSIASNIVTSDFGMRLHPIFGVYKMHNGIDIGASYGTDIVASDSGTVITAEYSSSYGYYIVIYHGNGYSSLYAHMSKMLVSVGDEVKWGDRIGLVGSTGNSTGPHLHFEIRQNGEKINPLGFFDSNTYTVR